MKKLFRILAGMMSVSLLFAVTACSKKETPPEETTPAPTAPEETTVENTDDLTGEEVFWLAPYDINPVSGNDRSVALTLFEDQFHGKITWIPCTEKDKFEVLSNRILGGDPVDMFPYEPEAFPEGVYKQQYEPLDEYLNLNDPVWADMKDAIEMYAWQGKHYVVPYAVSDPVLLTYSRTMCEENDLDDPYKLYQSGKWDWDTFMDMMDTFVSNGKERYGICGSFGKALLQSTGKTVVGFNGTQFTNNISDPALQSAGSLMSEISENDWYDTNWYRAFPSSQNVLFYASGDWSLAGSNEQNEDADLMAVPFPKSPDADKYYLSGNYDAKMLVKNSRKGKAVAAYLYCERLAQTESSYQEIAKKNALQQEVSASGEVLSYMTEEQYDAIQSYKTDNPVLFDFGYGMGKTMYSNGEYTYETKGVMNKLNTALLTDSPVDSWEELQEAVSPVIDEALAMYS